MTPSSTAAPSASEPGACGLRSDLRDGVLWLAFDRPRAANAVDAALAHALAAALHAGMEDSGVRAAVLTGAGGRVFSAGIDVRNPDGLDHAALSTHRRQAVEVCMNAVLDFEKPLLAAVNGPAVGLGCMLALLTDRVVASPAAAFSLPEIDIGIPTFLGVSILRHACGAAVARDLVLTGRRMTPAEALGRGLIAMVAAADSLEAVAQAEAGALATKPQTTYALAKRWLARGLREELDAANAHSASVQPLLEGH